MLTTMNRPRTAPERGLRSLEYMHAMALLERQGPDRNWELESACRFVRRAAESGSLDLEIQAERNLRDIMRRLESTPRLKEIARGLASALRDACASIEVQSATAKHYGNVGLAEELARNAKTYRAALTKAERVL